MKWQVPKFIHFIWIGGPMRGEHKDRIADWCTKNPHYTVHLWIDSNNLLAHTRRQKLNELNNPPDPTKVAWKVGPAGDAGTARLLAEFNVSAKDLEDKRSAAFADIKDFCESNGVVLKDARDILPDMHNAHFYEREMVDRGGNFGAASDILRVAILIANGGIYFDTDVKCKKALGSIRVQKSAALWGSDNAGRICNSIIACHKGCESLVYYRKLIRQNYKKLLDDDSLMALYYDNVRSSTIRTTGPSVAKQAAEKRIQNAKLFDKEWMKENVLFPQEYVEDLFEHAWLG